MKSRLLLYHEALCGQQVANYLRSQLKPHRKIYSATLEEILIRLPLFLAENKACERLLIIFQNNLDVLKSLQQYYHLYGFNIHGPLESLPEPCLPI